MMYWRLGERIFVEEQREQERAEYGAYLIKNLASMTENEFGSGFSVRQLELARQFYRTYPIANALRSQSYFGAKTGMRWATQVLKDYILRGYDSYLHYRYFASNSLMVIISGRSVSSITRTLNLPHSCTYLLYQIHNVLLGVQPCPDRFACHIALELLEGKAVGVEQHDIVALFHKYNLVAALQAQMSTDFNGDCHLPLNG
jgi:hypothetical protein